MEAVTTLAEMVIVLGAPAVLFAALVRLLLDHQPMGLFAPPAELPWPPGVQEPDVPPVRFDALQEPAIDRREQPTPLPGRSRVPPVDARHLAQRRR